MDVDLPVQYPLSMSDFNNLEFWRKIFEKYSNIKFKCVAWQPSAEKLMDGHI